MEFDVSEAMMNDNIGLRLELGGVYELARVTVNGHCIGVTWFPPFQVELTDRVKSGRNSLRIDVPNLLKNHLERGDDYTRPSGLMGPVVLRPFARVVLDPQ